MAGLPEGPFWRFSLAFYARPGVAEACLALQDREGADVNLLLLALWLGARGHRLDAAAGRRLAGQGRDWQNAVVAPLRQVRRRLKAHADLPWPEPVAALRRDLAGVELGLEQVEQALLEATLGQIPDLGADPAAMQLNLSALGLDGLAETAEWRMLQHVAAAFPAGGA